MKEANNKRPRITGFLIHMKYLGKSTETEFR